MAHGTVVSDGLAILCVMTPVMAAEAPWIVIVAEVIGMRSPADPHVWKDIAVVYGGQRLGCLIDLRALSAPYGWKLGAIEIVKFRSDLCSRFLLRSVTGLDE